MPAEPQGMLNFMVFLLKEKNALKVSETHLQTVVPVKTIQELNKTFIIKLIYYTFKNNFIKIFNKSRVKSRELKVSRIGSQESRERKSRESWEYKSREIWGPAF